MNSSDKSGKRNVHSTQPESDRTDSFKRDRAELRAVRLWIAAGRPMPDKPDYLDEGQIACMAELTEYD
jgi:hypothetical protein